MILETPRLILRQWEERDLEPYAALNADPRVMEYFPKLLTRDEVKNMIETRLAKHIRDKGYGLWCAELKSLNECIGFIGIQVPPFEVHFNPSIEIGWRLAHKVWGQGLAGEGARKVLEYSFGQLRMPEMLAMASKINVRSQNVMKKLGMTYVPEYDFDHPKLEIGSPIRPHVTYRIKAEEFKTRPL